MRARVFGLWRPIFFVSALLIMAGGARHPRGGTMEAMLGDASWVPSHSFLLAGFVALLAGLIVYGRTPSLPPRTRRWLRIAIAGTVLQVVEMAMHTAAVVDHANLVAGKATPVLTTHLWMSIVLYPVFAATVAGFIVATALDRSLGSRWIAWLGLIGLAAHGAAPTLVLVLSVPGAGILFPMLLLFALWLALAALLPVRTSARAEAAERPLAPRDPAPPMTTVG